MPPECGTGRRSQEDGARVRRGIYEGISEGDPKEEINQMVGLPEKLIYMVNLRDYSFDLSDEMTIESILLQAKRNMHRLSKGKGRCRFNVWRLL